MDLIKNLTTSNNRNACILFEENFQRKISYFDLNEETLELKNYIFTNLKLPEHICVGISIKTTSISFFSALCSVLQSNMAFILFEPNQLNKNLKIIKDLQLKTLIGDEDFFKNFKEQGFTFNSHDFSSLFGSKIHIIEIQDYDIKPTFKNVMYVIKTSGTTGEQKYVRVSHESLHSNIIHLRNIFEVTENDYIYFGTPLSFDPCMIEIFLSLTTGATLVVVSPEIRRQPNLLKQIIFPKTPTYFPGVTILQMCPSVFLRWSENEINDILNHSSLRILALGGEQFPETILHEPKKVRIFNLYGITEVSCWASICEIKNGEVNLGEPLKDTILEVRKLEENQSTVQEGEGVLFIGSTKRICLIKEEKFENIIPPLFRCTGDIVYIKGNTIKYMGRTNNMVKRYGFNINLTIIEGQILSSTQLRNKCVWLNNIKRIIAFICLPKNNLLDSYKTCDKIRAKLLRDLKDYEVPDLVEVIDDFPLTENGKIDTKSLVKLALKKYEYQDKSPIETFKILWRKYFDLQVPENKTFFEMGGTSILLLQFVEELKISNKNIGNDFINILANSMYENICKFLSISSNISESVDILQRNHLKSNVFCVKWKFDTQSCVDATSSLINISDNLCIAIGNFAGRFVILSEVNMEKLYDNYFPKSIENGCVQVNNLIFFGCFDGYFYCLSLHNFEIKWKFKTEDKIKNLGCIVLNESGIVFGSYDKHLYCININDGQLIWKLFIKEAITANIRSKDGLLFYGSLRGNIGCVNEINGNILWNHSAKHPIFSSAEFVTSFEGIIFSDVCSVLYCFDIKTGAMKWIYEPKHKQNLYSSVLIWNKFIFFGTSEKYIHVLQFDDNSCKLQNELNIGHKITATPVFYQNNYIIFVCTDGFIFLLSYCNNSISVVDFFTLGSESFSSPVISNNQLYIGCRDNFLYNIKLNLS